MHIFQINFSVTCSLVAFGAPLIDWSQQGGWELDESVEEAACRESLEEAGVTGLVEVLIGHFLIMKIFDFFSLVKLNYN